MAWYGETVHFSIALLLCRIVLLQLIKYLRDGMVWREGCLFYCSDASFLINSSY